MVETKQPHYDGAEYKSCIPFGKPKSRFSYRLCLSLWLIQDSNWKGELFGDYLEVSQQFFKTGFHVMNKK